MAGFLYSHRESFINNKDLLRKRFVILHVLVPLKLFSITFDFEYTYIKKLYYASGVYNECKSYEISNLILMFFNLMFPLSKTKDELVKIQILQNKTI